MKKLLLIAALLAASFVVTPRAQSVCDDEGGVWLNGLTCAQADALDPLAEYNPWVKPFSREWFVFHQATLLHLLNGIETRDWFGASIDAVPEPGWFVAEIGPTYYITEGPDGTRKLRTISRDGWGRNIYEKWGRVIVGDTNTSYPDPNPETNTVDGQVSAAGLDVSWATLITNTGTIAVDTGATGFAIRLRTSGTSMQWEQITRAFLFFDASAIGDSDTITAAVLTVVGNAKVDNLTATPNIDVYVSDSTSTTALATGDLLKCLTTSQTGAPISYASFDSAGDNAFTFSILTGISKTGISRFCLDNPNHVVANSMPTWSGSVGSNMEVVYAETANTTSDPELVVTYTPAGGTRVPVIGNGVFKWGSH
jgi:hypothetical protein